MLIFDLYQFLNAKGTHLDKTRLNNIAQWRWNEEGLTEKLLSAPIPPIRINIYGFVEDNKDRISRNVGSLETETERIIKHELLDTTLWDISILSQYDPPYYNLKRLYNSKESHEKKVKFCERLLNKGTLRRMCNFEFYSTSTLEKNQHDATKILGWIKKIDSALIKIGNSPVNIHMVPEAQQIHHQVQEILASPLNFLDFSYNKVNVALLDAYGINSANKTSGGIVETV